MNARKTRSGRTALHYACGREEVPIIEALLGHGADPNLSSYNGRETPLHEACECGGRIEVARLLINHGASIEAVNEQGQTALHLACRHGHLRTIYLMVESGANVSVKDNVGRTPFDRACENYYIDVLFYFMKQHNWLSYLTSQHKE